MEQSRPSAKIIADSISEQGHRVTTMEVKMHRFILAEMNTHRAFSRNSASSRAIPVEKIMSRVREDPAYPVHWGKEQKGMQSGDEFGDDTIPFLMEEWDSARTWSLRRAQNLNDKGLHKFLVNRLLEPFMWHTAIITATEWDNFFWQRCDPMAQPEMKCVADMMQLAYYSSTPKLLAHGEWHLPYIRQEDWDEAWTYFNEGGVEKVSPLEHTQLLKAVSTARCARVSYLTQDGVRSMDKDIDLFERLRGSGHWSPFEHVATPVVPVDHRPWGATGEDYKPAWVVYDHASNFIGWKQYRKEFKDENRTNFLPNLPELAEVRKQIEKQAAMRDK